MKFDYEIVIDSVAVLLGDYSVIRKKAAILLLKAFLPHGRIDLNNGMCLCHACHTEEHKFDPSYHMMKSKISGGSDG